MTCLALLGCLSLLAVPQGPKIGGAAVGATIDFPVRPEEMSHAPFVDATGLPLGASVRRFGTLDLDGNRIPDAFWLGDAGPGVHELAIAMGREHSPGRFRPWPVPHGLAGGIADAAPLRQAWLEQDTLLLADPNAQHFVRLSFDLGPTGNPHTSGWFTTASFTALPPAFGAVQLATANLEGDGCDDVVVVYDHGAAGHSIVKYELDAPFGVPLLVRSTRADLPWSARRVRLCDFDGDGRADVAAELPGLGVVVGRDDGSGLLQPLAWIPAGALVDLDAGPFGASDALALTTDSGVLVAWLEGAALQSHWLPAAPATTTGNAALLPRATSVEVVALATDGRTLRLQTLTRGQTPPAVVEITPQDPAAYYGFMAPCGLAAADLDGDGDTDLVVQHPDAAQWYTIRHEHAALRPALVALSQDLSLTSLGWYGATYELAVPAHWDLVALPQIELQVMLEHPYTGQQLRWDRQIQPIDPVTRRARFTVQWQDSMQTTAQFLNNPNLVPPAFAQAGHLTAGRRTQLTFLGMGLGNASYAGADRRTEPLLLFTDPGGSGNKSAQGVVWEKRTAPPLPKADTPLLPWQ